MWLPECNKTGNTQARGGQLLTSLNNMLAAKHIQKGRQGGIAKAAQNQNEQGKHQHN